ncbi:unnamed protein product [Boreogadus saida]
MHMQQPCVTGARAIGGTSPPLRQVSSTHPIAALNLGTLERRKASLCRQMALLLQSVSAAESSDGAVMQGKLVFHHSEVLLPGADCTPRGFNSAGLELGAAVEVMEAVVWRCSSGGPWRSSGGARREVRGGRLEALAAGGGKAGSCAAQRMQNGADCTPEASTERVWSWELQVDGGQEPFSPTGTDGGDGGARLEVRGGRLEVLAVRAVAVVWRRR